MKENNTHIIKEMYMHKTKRQTKKNTQVIKVIHKEKKVIRKENESIHK